MNITKRLVAVTWSIVWRVMAVAMGAGFVIGLLVGLAGGTTGSPLFGLLLYAVGLPLAWLFGVEHGLKANDIKID